MSILGTYGDKIIDEIRELLKNKKKDKVKQQYADTVVRNLSGEILLLQRSSQDDFMPEKWGLAGGKIEEGEEPHIAAARELLEETGIVAECTPLKTIVKDDCVIYYHESVIPNDTLIVLDNEEHYHYEFTPLDGLYGYDLLFDLEDILINELLPLLHPIMVLPQRELTPEEAVIRPESPYLQKSEINAAFDSGLIEDEDYLKYLQVKKAYEVITKAHEQDVISDHKFYDILEKGKHFEFVKVVRDGKTFYQYREVGTNKIEEDVEIGTEVDTNEELDLRIKKYSDKSILISGNTYKNVELLRQAKQEAGFGAYNKALGGWIFPIAAKDKIMALIAAKMPIDTYDETVAKEAAIAVKNACDVGTPVSFDSLYSFDDLYNFEAEITGVEVNEAGKVEYTVETKEDDAYTAKSALKELASKSTFEQFMRTLRTGEVYGVQTADLEKELNLVHGDTDGNKKKIEDYYYKDGKQARKERKEEKKNNKEEYQNELANQNVDNIMAIAKEQHDKMEAALNEKKEEELPIGSISPDGTKIKTANGWEHIKQEKKVTEKEIAIPPADENKAEELINSATEENRFKVGKQLFGKEAGEEPVSVDIEKEGQKEVKIEVREFTTRSGEKINALDFKDIKPYDIQLIEQEDILNKPKPYWIPDINEKVFAGIRDDNFVFDYVKYDDNNVLLALNGYNKQVFGRNISQHALINEELKNDLISKKYSKKQLEKANIWGNPDSGYKIVIDGKTYDYGSDSGSWKKDQEALLNNHESSFAIVSVDQMVAIQDYYVKKRKAEIEEKKQEKIDSRLKYFLEKTYPAMNEKQREYYYPFDYDKRLSKDQKKRFTKEQWEALPLEEKVKEIQYMSNRPIGDWPSAHKISQLSDDRMWKDAFRMYKQYVNHDYTPPFKEGQVGGSYDHTDVCYQEYEEVRKLIKWKRLDLNIQREENSESYKKGFETSYGETGTKDTLLDTHGVKIKSQNGKKLGADQEVQIKEALTGVYNSFGDRTNIAKEANLKISHAGSKYMFAQKALGLYIPSMNAIGVSNNQEHDKFGFTLAHEFAHFIDNHLGKKQNRNWASDNHNSTAGKIAFKFRELMNKGKFTDSDYANRTCECFARALEQYHAVKTEGDDAIKSKTNNKPYHMEDGHVSKYTFKVEIQPLIEQFLSENDHLLKSAYSELNLIDINNGFEIIKAAFDEDKIEPETYLQYQGKYNAIVKSDPSHGGKLVKKTSVDKMGKKETKWVKRGEAEGSDKTTASTDKEPVTHSKNVLGAFAKETPEKELKRVISESHDEKLRAAAHAELDRRDKKEKPQEDKKDKPAAKKTVEKKEKAEPKKDDKLAEKKDVKGNDYNEDSILNNLIEDFKNSKASKEIVDDYDDADKLKGQCDTIAERFAKHAILNGVDKKKIKLIEGIGLKNGLSEGHASAYEEYKNLTKFLGHVVVQVGKTVIDLTGKQFGKDYSKTTYTEKEFKTMWGKVKDWKTYNEA